MTPKRYVRTSDWRKASAQPSCASRSNGRQKGLIAFAQREGITHVIFGQSARSRWELLWRGSTIDKFLSTIRDAAVQVVPPDDRAA
jgi:K+-sensing histidine kinase KdpD